MRREAGTGIEIGLLAILSFGVLAYGSTSYWARAILQAAIAVLFVCWWISAARSRLPAEFEPTAKAGGLELGGVRFRASGLGILAALFALTVVLQLVPLPASVRSLLAPGLAAMETPPGEVLSRAGEGAAEVGWRSLSVSPGLTVDGLLQFMAYAALFIVAYNLCDSRDRILRIAQYLVVFGFVVALIGLLQDLSGAERLYGIKVLRYGGSPYGPFVNHNHFAGFMELIVPLTFALFLRRLFRPGSRTEGWKIASGGISLPGAANPRGERSGQVALLVLALAVMCAALLLSSSRGGLLALGLSSMTVIGLLALRGRLGRWEVAALAMVLTTSLALFLWIGPGPVLEHYRSVESGQNEPSLRGRALVWQASMGIVRDFPVLGSGLSSYPVAFLPYYPLGTEQTWLQAHNDYVQLLTETGVVGGLVAALGLLVVLIRLLRPVVGSASVSERFLYYGFCTSILSILVHSLVDFNLHVPGNAALFVVILALALAHGTILQREPHGSGR